MVFSILTLICEVLGHDVHWGGMLEHRVDSCT